MGTFSISIEISGMDRERFETVDALVDDGVTYTMLPASLLNSLGIAPLDKQAFFLDSGERVYRDIGQMPVRINGEVWVTPVVFSDETTPPTLGMVTLSEFCLEVDHENQRLIEATAFLPSLIPIDD